MLPEDCFEDEVYDPVDGVCYLACEVDDSCEGADAGFQGWLEAFAANLSGFIAGEETAGQYFMVQGHPLAKLVQQDNKRTCRQVWVQSIV